MDLVAFRTLPVVGILRGVTAAAIDPLVESVVAAGLGTVEITMNTPGAGGLIRQMVRASGGRLTVGAGTVLTTDDLRAARDAGASFIVMPTLVREVVDACVRDRVPVFPGALTPQEIHDAWTAGATMVKVFPAKFFGPPYFREIKGPFRDIALLACGGVAADNVAAFLAAGADAVAFGASIFRDDWLAAGAYDRIGAAVAELVAAVRRAQATA